jgi:uncharacterized protein
MKKGWVHPQTISGPAAEGKNYFRRIAVEDSLWREISKGSHILFSAPRRVGKSSVMKYIAKNPPDGYACTYDDIESDISTHEFYKRLLEIVMQHVKNPKGLRIKAWFKRLGIDEASLEGFKFLKKDHDYKSELLSLLPHLKDEGKRIVIFLDEFPDVLKNIRDKEGAPAAADVLHTLRSMRHDENFKGHFSLVLAGSVGLAHVVKDIGRMALINDLHEQNLPALSTQVRGKEKECEAERFIDQLLEGATMRIDRATKAHLLKQLGQAIPYYLQLMVEECNNVLYDEERDVLEIADIEQAWANILGQHKHFEDADQRLSKYFHHDYPYFLEVLKLCAHQDGITIQELFDLGKPFKVGADFKAKIDDVLIKDGYLFEDGLKFKFVSPLLQAWWKARHPLIIKKK